MALAVPTHHKDLCKLIASAQENAELSDMKLAVSNQVVSVHKLIVCLQSPVLKAACTGSFKEASGTYEIKDYSFSSVLRMVEFFYTGDYKTERLEDEKGAIAEILAHVHMFSLADKYLIQGLRGLSHSKFKEAMRKEKNVNIISKCVKPVYDLQFEASNSLRYVVTETVRARVSEMPFDLDIRRVMDGLLGEVPEFAKDLAMSYIRYPIMGTPFVAPKVRVSFQKKA
ncbi:hypothetical protein V8C44DRAFT_335855 [Trichoderma aethiopicum]